MSHIRLSENCSFVGHSSQNPFPVGFGWSAPHTHCNQCWLNACGKGWYASPVWWDCWQIGRKKLDLIGTCLPTLLFTPSLVIRALSSDYVMIITTPHGLCCQIFHYPWAPPTKSKVKPEVSKIKATPLSSIFSKQLAQISFLRVSNIPDSFHLLPPLAAW